MHYCPVTFTINFLVIKEREKKNTEKKYHHALIHIVIRDNFL